MLGLGGVIIGITAACASNFDIRNYPTTQALFDASEERFRRGKCDNAETGLREVLFQLTPRDSLAIRARFLLAECLMQQGQYLEAARQFRRLVQDVPSDPLAPRALLRLGDAQAELWKRPELDPTYGQAAQVTYRELTGRYPGTPAARRAQLKLNVLAARFAEKEYKNGVFYYRLGAYDSALLYFRNVVAQYGQTALAPLALVKLVETYEHLDYDEERIEMCNQLRRFYPQADRADEVCPEPAPAP